ncbi:3'-5' exonuclease [Saccharicrinis aurantiacus]|uniref:3'-5' exonuclease n=1 Tax=Saccharicrinis aurantiacus TaxID=1849719 RepID=UPI001FE498CA|nr:3'-5' exonuclease [Saccharicrinis aurantiacus]
MIYNSISNDTLNELPLRHYEGEVVVIENAEEIPQMMGHLKKCKVLGFDTETKPAFKKGQTNQISLLQISSEEKTFLVRLNKTGLTNELVELLASNEILKVGVGIRDDIRGLKRLSEFEDGGFIELQTKATDLGVKDFSLKKLAGILLEFRVSKRQRLSNWETETLSEGQITYAATDSWVALEIYKSLEELDPSTLQDLPETE